MERLEQATTQEAHKQVFEQLAKNLPVVTRTPQSGGIISRTDCRGFLTTLCILQFGIVTNVYISSLTDATTAVSAGPASRKWITIVRGSTTV